MKGVDGLLTLENVQSVNRMISDKDGKFPIFSQVYARAHEEIKERNETLVAAIRAGAGDRCGLMEQLYKQNEGIIRTLASKAAHGGDLFDDLMQEGYIALENAVNGFDPSAGVLFVTYFGVVLKWHFWGIMQASSVPVSLPSCLHERLAKYKATKAALEQEQAADVKPAQVAAAMGLDARQTAELELLLYQLRVVALDAPIDETGETTAGDQIADEIDVAGEVCDDAEREYNRRLVVDALQRDLDETERQIVQRFYRGEQIQKIADDVGMTYQQTFGVKTRAVQKLRRDTRLRCDYLRSCDLYHYSYRRFRTSGLSSVEFIAERNERLHEGTDRKIV